MKYHEWLTPILKEFEAEHKDKLKGHTGSIKLTSKKRHCKSIIEYEPDYWFTFKTGKKSFEYIIFEFLDSEESEGIFADIIECACIENCRMVIFLAEDAKKMDKSNTITDIVTNLLDDLNGDKFLDIITLHIPMSTNKEEAKKEISTEINRLLKLT